VFPAQFPASVLAYRYLKADGLPLIKASGSPSLKTCRDTPGSLQKLRRRTAGGQKQNNAFSFCTNSRSDRLSSKYSPKNINYCKALYKLKKPRLTVL
jgi:hypothetical protein